MANLKKNIGSVGCSCRAYFVFKRVVLNVVQGVEVRTQRDGITCTDVRDGDTYTLLWVVTLSTIMLIILQHNVAHLGIVTGLCLSEAATRYSPRWVSRPILATAVLASISTSLAEILGGAIALQMLFGIPVVWGAVLTTALVVIMLFTIERPRPNLFSLLA